MGRRATGFHVRWRATKGAWYVRFTLDGKRVERSTGVRDREAREEATRQGRAVYAGHVTGSSKRDRGRAAPKGGLGQWLIQWVEQLDDLRERTRTEYEKLAATWLTEFGSMQRFSEQEVEAYLVRRLRGARGKTIRNEASALRKFIKFAAQHGAIREPHRVASPASNVSGRPYVKRRRSRAPELSPDECRAILEALPIRSRQGLVVRARFAVMYETTLRPATLDALVEGTHYSRGAASLLLEDEDDKEAWGREVPLTQAARRWLDSVCTGETGHVLFGQHQYERHIRRAAKAVLDERRAAIFTGQHFRSAAITHYLERTGNLPGVQYLAGHKHASTTARYVRASLRAAKAVLAAQDMGARKRGPAKKSKRSPKKRA